MRKNFVIYKFYRNFAPDFIKKLNEERQNQESVPCE